MKNIIFYGEKPLNEVYAHATKWQVFKYRVYQFKFRTLRVLFIISTLVLVGMGARFINPHIVYKAQEAKTITVTKDTLTPVINDLKNKVISDIRECERAGYTEDDAPVILDTNKKMSFGTLMYQKDTVIYYYKKLYGKDITKKEAVLIALDDEKAKSLAYDVIFTKAKKGSEGWRNWSRCSIQKNVPDQLQVINSLENHEQIN